MHARGPEVCCQGHDVGFPPRQVHVRTMNQLLSDLMMLLLLGRTPQFHIEEDVIIVLRV